MTLSAKQFQYLSEMGIQLWQRKELSKAEPIADVVPVDVDMLLESQLFSDILLALGLTIADSEITEEMIKLPTLNWYFVNDSDIQLSNNQLITEPISRISEDTNAKKLLWQRLSTYE